MTFLALLRDVLLVYPLLALYVVVVAAVFVPLTLIIGNIGPIYAVARFGAGAAVRLAGLRVNKVHEEHALEHPTCVFVCNHVSNVDPPVLFSSLPRVAVILKQSLGRIPVLGYVMGMGGFIYVDRHDRESRRKALEASVATLRAGTSLLIFPEGTRGPGGELLAFRPGPFSIAIDAQVPVVPITIHGTRDLMTKGSLAIQPGEVTLVFHPPVPTTGMTLQDRTQLMAGVREVMTQALQDHPD